jgi:tetratricopeptide (TPR) repeat protein
MPENETHNTNIVNVGRSGTAGRVFGGATGVIIGVVVGLVVGSLIGFFIANGLNRQEQDKMRAELASARAGGAAQGAGAAKGRQGSANGDDSPQTITEEQITNAITKADQSPQDAELQKKVGQGLLLYASQTGSASFLSDGARILKRAHDLDPKDFKTTVLAGDAQFLVERQGNGDAKLIAEARKLYEAALVAKPDDAVVRTKFGLTYFYDNPPNPQRAISEYRRALQADPRQEMALQSIVAALINTGDLGEAARQLDELEKVNPSNEQLSGLRSQLEQMKNAAKEK